MSRVDNTRKLTNEGNEHKRTIAQQHERNDFTLLTKEFEEYKRHVMCRPGKSSEWRERRTSAANNKYFNYKFAVGKKNEKHEAMMKLVENWGNVMNFEKKSRSQLARRLMGAGTEGDSQARKEVPCYPAMKEVRYREATLAAIEKETKKANESRSTFCTACDFIEPKICSSHADVEKHLLTTLCDTFSATTRPSVIKESKLGSSQTVSRDYTMSWKAFAENDAIKPKGHQQIDQQAWKSLLEDAASKERKAFDEAVQAIRKYLPAQKECADASAAWSAELRDFRTKVGQSYERVKPIQEDSGRSSGVGVGKRDRSLEAVESLMPSMKKPLIYSMSTKPPSHSIEESPEGKARSEMATALKRDYSLLVDATYQFTESITPRADVFKADGSTCFGYAQDFLEQVSCVLERSESLVWAHGNCQYKLDDSLRWRSTDDKYSFSTAEYTDWYQKNNIGTLDAIKASEYFRDKAGIRELLYNNEVVHKLLPYAAVRDSEDQILRINFERLLETWPEIFAEVKEIVGTFIDFHWNKPTEVSYDYRQHGSGTFRYDPRVYQFERNKHKQNIRIRHLPVPVSTLNNGVQWPRDRFPLCTELQFPGRCNWFPFVSGNLWSVQNGVFVPFDKDEKGVIRSPAGFWKLSTSPGDASAAYEMPTMECFEKLDTDMDMEETPAMFEEI